MTSISEFERNKPRKTYAEIVDFERDLEDLRCHGIDSLNVKYVLSKIRSIKKIFLSGE